MKPVGQYCVDYVKVWLCGSGFGLFECQMHRVDLGAIYLLLIFVHSVLLKMKSNEKVRQGEDLWKN